MAAVDADVWILTEGHAEVSPGETYRLGSQSDRAGDRTFGEYWVGIWSRLPASAIMTVDGDRSAAIEIEIAPNRSMVVFGTVLPWLGSKWREHPAKDGVAFIASLTQQAADWKALRAGREGRELVVAGDFNQDLLARGHYYGSKIGRIALRAALHETGLTCPVTSPIDVVQCHTRNTAASIDHICISDGLRVTGSPIQVWPPTAERGAALSDHFGVCVEVAAS